MIRLRLKKAEKLRFKSQFDQIRQDGHKSVTPALSVVVAPSPEGRLECGVICSKKYSLLSVVRNRARRLMWESFRILKPGLSPCRILLIPRRRMMKLKRQEVTAIVAEILIRENILDQTKLPPQSL
ncbi:MAG: ribonuclease P protein component [Lentisphaeria bacterium]|nr:ribonuclease P protein component [Lentisphaeria bacterium]